jgi:putative addiction module component (TIGR02574 family)
MASIDDAFSLAQSLSFADQQILIERLLTAQPQREFTPPASHLVEVERRWAEFEAGRMKAIPWEEVWAEVNAELGLNE